MTDGHELHDDRGRDVGHDVEGEDRHALDGAAREHVEHAEDAAALLLEDLGEGGRIDAGHRDVGAEAIDDQRAQGEPDALLELVGLGEGAEIDIGGKLFGCRCHIVASRPLALRGPYRRPGDRITFSAPAAVPRQAARCFGALPLRASASALLGLLGGDFVRLASSARAPLLDQLPTAAFDAPCAEPCMITVSASLAFSSPLPSRRTPSRRGG